MVKRLRNIRIMDIAQEIRKHNNPYDAMYGIYGLVYKEQMNNTKVTKSIPKANKELISTIDRMIWETFGAENSFGALLQYGFSEYRTMDIEYNEVFIKWD
jgi:hypothetical protein